MLNFQGMRFGRLLVERRVAGGSWLCQCDCGKVTVVLTSNLKKGNSRSCGCARKETTTTHGRTDSPEYLTWKAMKHRCVSKHPNTSPNYRERGISVCAEWDDFVIFLKDMGTRPTPRHQLDRIDNDKGYSRENCRWVTGTQNRNNTRQNRYIEFDGKRQTIAEWANELGINYRTLNNRINRGWSIARAMTTP